MLDSVDCACVIHSDGYSWEYVERLHSMLSRNFFVPVRLHVYTESTRDVPSPFIKHSLIDWGIAGPKKSWWYKMQLFNSEHYAGPLLYFDLDVVIVNQLDWIYHLPTEYFWGIRDFKYLWRPAFYGINSSMLWWDTSKYHWLWEKFNREHFDTVTGIFKGDQDYITYYIPKHEKKYFDTDCIKSWRWELLDGGYDFNNKRHWNLGIGTSFDEKLSVMIFHGDPKPDQINDPIVANYWR